MMPPSGHFLRYSIGAWKRPRRLSRQSPTSRTPSGRFNSPLNSFGRTVLCAREWAADRQGSNSWRPVKCGAARTVSGSFPSKSAPFLRTARSRSPSGFRRSGSCQTRRTEPRRGNFRGRSASRKRKHSLVISGAGVLDGGEIVVTGPQITQLAPGTAAVLTP